MVKKAAGVLKPFDGKLAILADEATQSAGEFMARARRVAPKAKVFGSTIAGTDGNTVFFEMPGGPEDRYLGHRSLYTGKERHTASRHHSRCSRAADTG